MKSNSRSTIICPEVVWGVLPRRSSQCGGKTKTGDDIRFILLEVLLKPGSP